MITASTVPGGNHFLQSPKNGTSGYFSRHIFSFSGSMSHKAPSAQCGGIEGQACRGIRPGLSKSCVSAALGADADEAESYFFHKYTLSFMFAFHCRYVKSGTSRRENSSDGVEGFPLSAWYCMA